MDGTKAFAREHHYVRHSSVMACDAVVEFTHFCLNRSKLLQDANDTSTISIQMIVH